MTRFERPGELRRFSLRVALAALTVWALTVCGLTGSAGAADPGSGDPEPNAAGTPAGKPGPIPSGSSAGTPGPRLPDSLPAPRRIPGVERLPAPDLGRGLGDSRGHLPDIAIASVSYDGDCPRAGDEVVIEGRGFGASQGAQQLTLRRSGVGGRYAMPVVRWSPIRIRAQIPSVPGVEAGASYVVDLSDVSAPRERWISAGRPFRLCDAADGTLQVLVQASPDCRYEVGDVRVFAVDARGRRTLLGPPTGGFHPRGLYEARLPLGEYGVEGDLPGGPPSCGGRALASPRLKPNALWGWRSNPKRVVLSESRPLAEMTLRYDRVYLALPEGSAPGERLEVPDVP